MVISSGQMVALCRFNRNFNVKQIELEENVDTDGFHTLNVHAVLGAGATQIHKAFTLDDSGNLVGVASNEGSPANSANSAQ